MVFQIEYDDRLIDIVETISQSLEGFGLTIEDDGEEHNGFMIFTIKKIAPSPPEEPADEPTVGPMWSPPTS